MNPLLCSKMVTRAPVSIFKHISTQTCVCVCVCVGKVSDAVLGLVTSLVLQTLTRRVKVLLAIAMIMPSCKSRQHTVLQRHGDQRESRLNVDYK